MGKLQAVCLNVGAVWPVVSAYKCVMVPGPSYMEHVYVYIYS